MQKINEDFEFLEEDRECSYYNDRLSDIRYKYLKQSNPKEQFSLLTRGWRRFGHMHFVPECKGCKECISMRICVDEFEFSKSQKRVFSKNTDTKVYIQAPTLSVEHLNLYDKYHKYMNQKKEWLYSPISPEEYNRSFVEAKNVYAKEILFMKDEKLIGVALIDVLPQGISSIYCYYDHDYEDLSIGKFSILAQIKIAKELKIPHIYLGYWIKDHSSMGYKDYYKPFEVLENRPTLNEEAIWRRYE